MRNKRKWIEDDGETDWSFFLFLVKEIKAFSSFYFIFQSCIENLIFNQSNILCNELELGLDPFEHVGSLLQIFRS